MPAKRELTMRQIRQMLRLHRDGVSAREIGRTLGVARSTVQDNLKRAAAAGLTPQKKGLLFEITGRSGGQARGLVSRAELQTILLLVEQEASRARWPPAVPRLPTQEPDRQGTPSVGKKRLGELGLRHFKILPQNLWRNDR